MEVGGTQLLPLHNPAHIAVSPRSAKSPRPPQKATRLSDVWDEREELFDIGEESDEEDGGGTTPHGPPPPAPKIVVTDSV